MKRNRSNPWPWIILAGLTVIAVGVAGVAMLTQLTPGASGGRVGLVEYSGVITDQGQSSMLGFSQGGARDFIKNLERAGRDASVKAIVLRVNSPGGSPSASQEIYQAIRRVRKSKPVVCSMGDAAASGGYYIAAACDKIYANASTITGSIGVISQSLNFHELLKKYGVRDATQKSGRYKDMGNPFGPIDPAHVQYEQALINNIYQQFVRDVLAGRKNKLTRAQLLKLADGRIYTGEQAKANGLVDDIGGLHETIAHAAKLGGVKISKDGSPSVKSFSSGGLFGSFDPENSAGGPLPQAALQIGQSLAATAGRACADALVDRLKSENSLPAPKL